MFKKRTSRGYYEQITLQQTVSGETKAEMLIWSKIGYVTLSVEFDTQYWEETMYPSLKLFFTRYIVPEILTNRIQNELASTPGADKVRSESADSTTITESDTESDLCDTGDELSSSEEEQLTAAPAVNTDSVASHTPSLTNNSTVHTTGWSLGCEVYCKEAKAPRYSKVRGQFITCDANLICNPGTRYHLFCEGFRRLPSDKHLSGHYACKKCREIHSDKENLLLNEGFYQ